jgi:hypothetical protein
VKRPFKIVRDAFDRRCAECHGRDAAGTAVGPPLVHSIYRPAHHDMMSPIAFITMPGPRPPIIPDCPIICRRISMGWCPPP